MLSFFNTYVQSGLVLIISLYLVFFINHIINFLPWGIIPRTTIGIKGIFTSVWFHGDLNHLLSNSIPLFFLLIILKFHFLKSFIWILLILTIGTGAIVWLLGSEGNHIGASGLVFSLSSFLIISAFYLKSWNLLLPLILFFLFYSNLFLGLIPSFSLFPQRNISYLSHWSGLIVGILFGIILFSKKSNKNQTLSN